MDRNENNVIILIYQLNGFLYLAVYIRFHQTAENSHSVIYMHHIVPYLEGVQFVQRKPLASGHFPLYLYPMVSVENLMIRIKAQSGAMIDKSSVNGIIELRKPGHVLPVFIIMGKDVPEPFYLLGIIAADENFIIFRYSVPYIIQKQVEILVESRLGSRIVPDLRNILFPGQRAAVGTCRKRRTEKDGLTPLLSGRCCREVVRKTAAAGGLFHQFHLIRHIRIVIYPYRYIFIL